MKPSVLKHSLSLCLVILSSFCAKGQSIIEDVLTLEPYLNSYKDSIYFTGTDADNELQKVAEILSKYIPEDSLLTSGENVNTVITNHYGDNPFFDNFRMDQDGNLFAGSTNSLSIASLSSDVSGLFSQASNLNVTNFADGLASFLVSRAKTELSNTFFADMKKAFACFPELTKLFPKSAQFLSRLESYQISTFLGSLQQAFQDDINDIFGNAENVISLQGNVCNSCSTCKLKTNCNDRLDFYDSSISGTKKFALLSFLKVSQGLYDGKNPADLLHSLANDTSLSGTYSSGTQVLKLGDFISQSLLSSDPNRIWVPKDSIEKVVNNPQLLQIYLGLLYQQSLSPEFDTVQVENTKMTVIIKQLKGKSAEVKNYLTDIQGALDQVDAIITKVENLDPAKRADLIVLGSFAAGSISVITSTINFPGLKKSDLIKSEIEKWKSWVEPVRTIFLDYQQHNYSNLVLNVYHVLDTAVFKGNDEFDRIAPELFKYSTFMAAVAEAENSTEMEAAIEAFALPPGSASIKKNSEWNIAINGYLGFGYYPGATGIVGTDTSAISGINTQLRVAAPVGIAFSRGLGDKNRSSLSLFASLIDVGAIAEYRWNNDSSALETQISLGNIFSPGLSVVYGVCWNWPLTISAGYQLPPNTFGIDNGQFARPTFEEGFNIGISIDIPIVNLYNDPR